MRIVVTGLKINDSYWKEKDVNVRVISAEQNNQRLILEDGDIITPEGIIECGAIIIEDGMIVQVRSGAVRTPGRRISLDRKLVMPGIIDLYGDALETFIEPNPGSLFPLNTAILNFDSVLAICGITTMFHRIGFIREVSWKKMMGTNETAFNLLKEIYRLRDYLRVKHRFHACLDIFNQGAYPYLKKLGGMKQIQLLSLMDHTPGQGRFSNIRSYRNRLMTDPHMTVDEADEIIEMRISKREDLDEKRLNTLAEIYNAKKFPIVSHDDDSLKKVLWAKGLTASLSAFPVTKEAVRIAHLNGMRTVLGAPNVLCGKSQWEKINATEIILSGMGDILVSDDSPQSLFHAIFRIQKLVKKPLHEMIKMITLHPAQAVGLDEKTGSIEEGKTADLVVVNPYSEIPYVKKTFVDGQLIYRAQ